MLTSRAPLALLLAATACSGSPQQSTAAPAATQSSPTSPASSAPAPASTMAPVTSLPDDAPDATVKNVAATTGHANTKETAPPFAMQTLGQFEDPFAIAFLPDGSAFVTEKAGKIKLRRPDGSIVDITGAPKVLFDNQGGLLDIAPAPDFATSKLVYISYSEPRPGGSSLALARGLFTGTALVNLQVLWRAGSDGVGGQFGANILFAPDGKSLYLSSGERQRFTPAQDPDQAIGKILHLTLDGKPAPGNPMASAGGVRAQTWSSGHRNPYGMVFAQDGTLWEVEMGPRGGDELNLILPGKNYGWPIVSNGDNYSGKPIPDHPSRPDLEAPKLWWNPSISPGGMLYYTGAMFPEFRGNLFIGALSGEALIRVTLAGNTAKVANQYKIGERVRDVAQAPDGAIWLLEDGGKLVRLAKK
ncbi:PQQ-dependent sugar dehydrogenase [Sphingomonas sp. TREG-RG-20F-R18-01]|uniref:PQQ-dependent sugar dehydrogenase n=1 Tax=Sphingomonas sp. TREG-RG-20F-R18-01 TaxID=2914982 RepID=UPI001F57D7E9|nr:PQQ-dependent sugar dehydrogenase [Sphingomonas sp. TREG-RG-20F-R18-01]